MGVDSQTDAFPGSGVDGVVGDVNSVVCIQEDSLVGVVIDQVVVNVKIGLSVDTDRIVVNPVVSDFVTVFNIDARSVVMNVVWLPGIPAISAKSPFAIDTISIVIYLVSVNIYIRIM